VQPAHTPTSETWKDPHTGERREKPNALGLANLSGKALRCAIAKQVPDKKAPKVYIEEGSCRSRKMAGTVRWRINIIAQKFRFAGLFGVTLNYAIDGRDGAGSGGGGGNYGRRQWGGYDSAHPDPGAMRRLRQWPHRRRNEGGRSSSRDLDDRNPRSKTILV